MDWDTGRRNAGIRNTGNGNVGGRNAGNWNTGGRNAGDRNTGDRNTGDQNTGGWNTGHRNTGSRNAGHRNTGGWNTGDWNTGSGNAGHWNAGKGNTGSYNTGDWNTADHTGGCFCTTAGKIRLFDKASDLSMRDWWALPARVVLDGSPMPTEWVDERAMTDGEKAEHPAHKSACGYLRQVDLGTARQSWWDGLSREDKAKIYDIPNFDKSKFETIMGIKIGAET